MTQTNEEKAKVAEMQFSMTGSRIEKLLLAAEKVEQVDHVSDYKAKIEVLMGEFEVQVKECVDLYRSSSVPTKLQEIQRVLKVAEILYGAIDAWECSTGGSSYLKSSLVKQEAEDRAVRLPKINFRDLDEESPVLWFYELELQFEAHNVEKEAHKFALLLGLLSRDQSFIIYSVTTKDPKHPKPYTTAKQMLLDAFELKKYQRIEMAFSMDGFKYREKPSQFLARFQLLLGDVSVDDICQWQVMKMLPSDVRMTISHDTSLTSAEQIAKAADRLMANAESSGIQAVVYKKAKRTKVLCKYHEQYGDKALMCAGTPMVPCPKWNRSFAKKDSENFRDEQPRV